MATGKYIAISYATCVTAQVAFACYAIAMFTRRLMQQKRDPTAEEFMTARGTANKWKIGWSFFASAVGAWCITSPAYFAVNTGIVGLAMYAFASGIPVLLISLLGPVIQRLHPEVCTLPDFIGKRYGPVARTLVVCISLFNMSIAMLAEYIVVGALFKDFVGSVDYPIVIIVGVLTMTYTAYGGTYISIITDQLQGILTSILIVVLVIYVAITFRPEGGLPKPVPNDPNTGWALGANPSGYSAIFSMPCSLIAATVFSEAMWQKVWASESRRSVIFGGSFGFVLIMLAVFIFGFFGWLAAWAGYVVWGVTNDNLYMIQIFASQQDKENPGASTQVRSWIGVITLILACTMNEGAIDSLQNGIAAVFTQHFFKGQHTIFPRMVLVLLNIPLIVVSLQGYPILSLFLISNMLTTCCFLLVALGLWERAKPYITESGLVFGFCVAMLTCTAYGIGDPDNWDPSDPQLSIRRGAWYTWYGNWKYEWDYFLVAACFQLVGLIMWIVGAQLLKRLFGIEGPGISGLLRRLPGFNIITGSGFQRDLLGYRCMAPVARLLRHTPADQLPTTASYDYPAPALKDEAGSLQDALSVPPPPATVGAKVAGEGGVKGEEDRVSSDGSSGNAVEAKGV